MDNPFPSQKVKENGLWALLHNLSQKMGVTEIVINSPNSVFCEKEGKFYPLDIKLNPDHIMAFVADVALLNNKKCDPENPILDGILPDGSRINIIVAPFVREGAAITIRKYLRKLKTFDNSPGLFGLNPSWAIFLKTLVKARANVVVSGGTGVGKTTMLNLLLQEIPPEERVITIEDTKELYFELPNVVSMESGSGHNFSSASLTHRDLVKNSLRMRPDRIIIGEVRGDEIIDLLMSMNTGHDGSMTSIHANSPQECLSRMATLYLMGGRDVPMKAVNGQIQSAVNFVIQLTRTRNHKRLISHISEITGMEKETILTQNIAQLNNDTLVPTGIVPSIMARLHGAGLEKDFFKSAF